MATAPTTRQKAIVAPHAWTAVRVLKHSIIITGQQMSASNVDRIAASGRESGRTEAAAMASRAEDA